MDDLDDPNELDGEQQFANIARKLTLRFAMEVILLTLPPLSPALRQTTKGVEVDLPSVRAHVLRRVVEFGIHHVTVEAMTRIVPPASRPVREGEWMHDQPPRDGSNASRCYDALYSLLSSLTLAVHQQSSSRGTPTTSSGCTGGCSSSSSRRATS